MEIDAVPLPSSSDWVHRCRMQEAWIVLSVYLFIRIILASRFEWDAYTYGHVEELPFLATLLLGLVIIAIYIVSIIGSIRLALKRAFAPALIYAFISFIAPFANSHSLVMETKARIFAAYPNLCQTPIDPVQRLSICYGYYVNDDIGENEHIYFNPGDEMSLPPRQWPDDIKRIFNIQGLNSEDEPCSIRKRKRIVDHVYWISNGCCTGCG
jgi:hypothetical protein